jgi:hypothetical protein
MKPKTKKQLVCYHSEMAHSRPQNPINFRVDLFMRQRITVGVDFILRQRGLLARFFAATSGSSDERICAQREAGLLGFVT